MKGACIQHCRYWLLYQRDFTINRLRNRENLIYEIPPNWGMVPQIFIITIITSKLCLTKTSGNLRQKVFSCLILLISISMCLLWVTLKTFSWRLQLIAQDPLNSSGKSKVLLLCFYFQKLIWKIKHTFRGCLPVERAHYLAGKLEPLSLPLLVHMLCLRARSKCLLSLFCHGREKCGQCWSSSCFSSF